MEKFRAIFSFVFVTSLSVFFSVAMATKPTIPWQLDVGVTQLNVSEYELAITVKADIEISSLEAQVSCENAKVDSDSAQWRFALGVKELWQRRIRVVRSHGEELNASCNVVVSGANRYANMSRIKRINLTRSGREKISAPKGSIRNGAFEFPSGQ